MQPIHIEGHLLDQSESSCRDSQSCGSTYRFFAFLLPCIIVIGMNTASDWLDTPLITLSSFLQSFFCSFLPGVLAGLSGLVLYSGIKSVKRRLRAVTQNSQGKFEQRVTIANK